MSAETLRQAASLMREQHGPEHNRHAMWSAMADWVDGVAERHVPMGHPMYGVVCCLSCNLDLEGDERGHCDDFDDALAVAHAYLEAA